MPNPNSFTGQGAVGHTITKRMRRINALEFSAGERIDGPLGITQLGGNIYVCEATNSRVKIFNINGGLVGAFGSFGAGNGEFNGPSGITALGSEVYVVDSGNDRIQVFDADGAYQRQWGSFGTGNGEFDQPTGITVLSSEIYVQDTNNVRVQVFNSAGTYDRQWANAGPIDLFGFGSEIYTADALGGKPGARAHAVDVYNSTGTLQRTIGVEGTGDGEFGLPVSVGSDGTFIYVCDRNTDNRVQKFTTTGTFQIKWGATGSGDGEFTQLDRILGYNSEIYVSDAPADRIQVFDTDGVFVRKWGATGSALGVASTEFFGYQIGAAKVSLGTPDGGVAVPALAALVKQSISGDGVFVNGSDWLPEHYIDMRDAIEALAPFYVNVVTGNPFNWTDLSADNLYFKAMGDRTKYGASGGAAYDWTHDLTALRNDHVPYDIDIGEPEECIALLEASALV